jgi:arylsulfatase A-like enzyme
LSAAERPNILWIFVDDQGPDWGCYGNELVHTPVLDALAKEGTVYKRAFAVAPVCSVSHTSLYTGNYVTTLGVPHHRSHYQDELPKGYFHAEELLSKAGYFTVNMVSSVGGKEDRIIYGASGKTDFNFYRKTAAYKSKGINNQSGGEFFDHVHAVDNKDAGSYFASGEWEKRKKEQPFFAFINIETGKKHGWKRGDEWASQNKLAVDPARVKVPAYLADTPDIRKFLASKLNSVSHTDAVIGKFISALKRSGEYENTFIFIAGDHGYDFMRNKQTLYDSGLRVPMIIKWPGKKPTAVSEDLAGLIDIAPTSLAIAGVDIPTTMEGIDLHSKGAVSSRKVIFGTRDGVDGVFDMYRTVRNKRFRYIRHFYPEIPYLNGKYATRYLVIKEMRTLSKSGKLTAAQAAFLQAQKPAAEELYDLENDPDEINNLAGKPGHSAIQKELSDTLAAWMISNKDRDPGYRTLFASGKLKANLKVQSLIDKKAQAAN